LVDTDDCFFQAKDEARKAAAADNAELQVPILEFENAIPCSRAYPTVSFLSTAMSKMAARVADTASSQELLIGPQQVSLSSPHV
jgi:hypothetical protein